MPTYRLELELFSVLNASTSDFEIWTDGTQLGGGHTITSAGTIIIDASVSYGGSLPTSLEFRFDDADGGTVDQIEIRSVKINERYVNTGNYLSSSTLNDGGSSTVNVTNADFVFNQSAEPASSEFTTGATRVLTAGNDTVRAYLSASPEIFDALAGRDSLFLSQGNDKVHGGAGNDYIRGFGGDDLLSGGDDNDVVIGDAGDDEIYGGAGNDRLRGGADNDELHGGDGNDRLNGNAGDDVLTGGDGDDRLGGDAGADHLFGDAGDDILIGAAGADTMDGGADNDLMYGGNDDDIMNGGDGNDTLVGDNGDDILHGDDGDDILNGRADDDTLYGGAGDDILTGEDGVDVLDGGADNDVLVGGDGADTLDGGAGNDVLHGSGLTASEIQTILNANPSVVFNTETNSFYQFVNSNSSWAAADAAAIATTLSGLAGHLVTITSAVENAYVDSLSTNDIWLSGTDQILEDTWGWARGLEAGAQFWQGDSTGSAINNMYTNWNGGEPNDGGGGQDFAEMKNGGGWEDTSSNNRYVIEWEAGLISDDSAIDVLSGGIGNDYLYGYGGADVLDGDANDDVLFGGAGNDLLEGGTGDDVLHGGDGNDSLLDESGADYLNGGAGDDTIDASVGNDTVIGGTGDDHLTGGAGADTLYGGDDDDIILGDGAAIMQAGQVVTDQTSSTQWHTINFDAVITNPIIKLTMNTENDTDPITLRVRNVTDTGFEWQIDEYEYLDGIHGTETVSWLAVATGTHTLEDGTVIQANTTTATNNSFRNVTFNSAFGSAPVVMTQIMTTNESTAAVLHNENRSSTGFRLQIEEQEANGTAHTTETVGWIAIDNGGSVASGLLVGETGNSVTHATTSVSFGGTFGSTPVVLIDQQTEDGGDTAISRGSALSTTGFDVSIEEETSNDGETNHTTEVVGYYAMNAGVTYDSGTGTGDDTLYGGDGLDTLYGGAGADTFVFEVASAFADLDLIKDFDDSANDVLDFSDLIVGAFSGTITDYVLFNDDGTDITVQFDRDGTAGTHAFADVTLLENNTGLDEATLYTNGNIIV